MNDKEYDRLKKLALHEYHDAVQVAKARMREKLAGLEWVRAKAGGRAGTKTPVGERGDVVKQVESAITSLPIEFTTRDVQQQISATDSGVGESINKSSLSSALKRLVGTRLEVVEVGEGRRPTKFRRIA